jgi:hypothetical protein
MLMQKIFKNKTTNYKYGEKLKHSFINFSLEMFLEHWTMDKVKTQEILSIMFSFPFFLIFMLFCTELRRSGYQ